MNRLVVALAATVVILAMPARADDDDEKERSVLGGSPPIYAGMPVSSLVTQGYKRYRVVPREAAPAATPPLGSRCATSLGLFGPGRTLPVNTVCIGRDPSGQLAKGRVVPDGNGTYCATASGLFGPGAEQPIGLPCMAETKAGAIQGRITALK